MNDRRRDSFLLRKRIAELISLIFSAPIVAFFAFLVLLRASQPPNSLVLVLITLSFGTLVPLIFLYALLKQAKTSLLPKTQPDRQTTHPTIKTEQGHTDNQIIRFIRTCFWASRCLP